MSEEEPQRIEDPEKAHRMAIAGDLDRRDAVNAREAAELYQKLSEHHPFDDESDPDGTLREDQRELLERFREEAETSDVLAGMEEDRAGKEYDEERQAAERVIGEKPNGSEG